MTPHRSASAQSAKAAAFRQLHSAAAAPLVLVNVWDAASAKLVEEAGATALATSSSAVSWSLGFPDGNHLPVDLAVEAVRRIASATALPVTADIETGYAGSDRAFDDGLLRQTITAVLEAGAVGVNLEDSGGDPLTAVAEQARRIGVVRDAAEDFGVALFINARTDTYLSGRFPESAFEETLQRAAAYVAAGADGIFVPGVTDLHVLHELARTVAAPLNALAGIGAASVGELHDAGVRRISIGGNTAKAAYATVSRVAADVLGDGNWSELAGARSHAEMDALFAPRDT
ncbi:isocitrate lyase/phosphoenolpyruvate mutase family protein [Arthrobacter sp. KBS0703]|jgi:2-methylisocitrate lyase-like PEP mutase family enzyme|uniref:isocitrate lyase/PEP mutase family protein n=2 Tax=Bacteria TaxID=2 RepID=UPI00098F74F7|nr:isocitrate lyase/phosphoenolpyruvate mutase family protein [Arthrobacter sp. KBS0703]TSE17568.1 isocitrate lyase/phosphoenolpyruvate mutase family protein [Arthrobacter sp. KBS0703]